MISTMRALAVCLLGMTIGWSAEGADPVTLQVLSGTWSRSEKLADGSQVALMKIITPTHFAVFQQDLAGVNQNLFQSHSGTYELRDGVMTEHYVFSSFPKIRGTSGKCRVSIEQDTLRQLWMTEKGESVAEVWTRVREPSRIRTQN